MNKYLVVACIAFVCSLYAGAPSFLLPHQDQLRDQIVEDSGPGNWYEKLHWWREAKRIYTIDIQAALEHVKSISRSYAEKKKKFFEQLDKARSALPILPPSALTKTKKLIEELTVQLEQDPHDTDREDQWKKLQDLQKGFEEYSVLLKRIEEAYAKVLTAQVKAVEQYEEKALTNFEKIEHVFDDRKAHNYYLVVENSLDNMKAIIAYLVGPFYDFTEQASVRLLRLIPTLKTSLESLEQEGIYVREVSEAELAEKAAAEKREREARMLQEKEKRAQAERKAQPWWRSIGNRVTSFFSETWGLVAGKNKPQEQKKAPNPAQAVVGKGAEKVVTVPPLKTTKNS